MEESRLKELCACVRVIHGSREDRKVGDSSSVQTTDKRFYYMRKIRRASSAEGDRPQYFGLEIKEGVSNPTPDEIKEINRALLYQDIRCFGDDARGEVKLCQEGAKQIVGETEVGKELKGLLKRYLASSDFKDDGSNVHDFLKKNLGGIIYKKSIAYDPVDPLEVGRKAGPGYILEAKAPSLNTFFCIPSLFSSSHQLCYFIEDSAVRALNPEDVDECSSKAEFVEFLSVRINETLREVQLEAEEEARRQKQEEARRQEEEARRQKEKERRQQLEAEAERYGPSDADLDDAEYQAQVNFRLNRQVGARAAAAAAAAAAGAGAGAAAAAAGAGAGANAAEQRPGVLSVVKSVFIRQAGAAASTGEQKNQAPQIRRVTFD